MSKLVGVNSLTYHLNITYPFQFLDKAFRGQSSWTLLLRLDRTKSNFLSASSDSSKPVTCLTVALQPTLSQ